MTAGGAAWKLRSCCLPVLLTGEGLADAIGDGVRLPQAGGQQENDITNGGDDGKVHNGLRGNNIGPEGALEVVRGGPASSGALRQVANHRPLSTHGAPGANASGVIRGRRCRRMARRQRLRSVESPTRPGCRKPVAVRQLGKAMAILAPSRGNGRWGDGPAALMKREREGER